MLNSDETYSNINQHFTENNKKKVLTITPQKK